MIQSHPPQPHPSSLTWLLEKLQEGNWNRGSCCRLARGPKNLCGQRGNNTFTTTGINNKNVKTKCSNISGKKSKNSLWGCRSETWRVDLCCYDRKTHLFFDFFSVVIFFWIVSWNKMSAKCFRCRTPTWIHFGCIMWPGTWLLVQLFLLYTSNFSTPTESTRLENSKTYYEARGNYKAGHTHFSPHYFSLF